MKRPGKSSAARAGDGGSPAGPLPGLAVSGAQGSHQDSQTFLFSKEHFPL